MGRFLDWLDSRTGIKEIYNVHFGFILPEGTGFWTIFSGLTVGCILIQFVTGAYMLAYYVPVPDLAHESIKTMANTTDFGALFRNAHRWSATFAILFIFIHAVHIMARRAYRPPREFNWWAGLLLGFIFILMLITGIIMPWDWRSYWELIIWADWVDNIPLVGDYLKGPFLSQFTLGRNFVVHVIILPVVLIAVLAFHIYMFRRQGMADKV